MITVTEAKAHFNSLISTKNPTFVSKNGKPVAAIVPYALYKEQYQLWRDSKLQEAIEVAKEVLAGENEDALIDEELGKLLDKVETDQSLTGVAD